MKKLELWYDEEKGEVFFNALSVVILNRGSPGIEQFSLERIIGQGAGRIMYNTKKKSILSSLVGSINIRTHSKGEFALKLLNEILEMGYGVPELSEFDEKNKKMKVKIKNCNNHWEYEVSKTPICHSMAGTLAGIGEIVFEEGMDCVESKCIAKRDEFCEFEISKNNKPRSNIQREYVVIDKRKLKRMELVLDEKEGVIFFRNIPSEIHCRKYLINYIEELERIIGPAANTMMFRIGMTGAERALTTIHRYIIRLLSLFSKKGVFQKLLIEQFQKRGFGVPELVEFDEEKFHIKVRIRNTHTAVGHKKTNEPVCHVIRGIFVGCFLLLFGKKVECVESKCIAKGDEFCEFIISPEVKGL